MTSSSTRGVKTISLAEKTAAVTIISAVVLVIIHPFLAIVPLALFLAACFSAPFFTRFGFYLPIISHGKTEKPHVALTFDDGPDPVSTPYLLSLLEKHHAPATFFVTGAKAKAFPQQVHDILKKGHTLGNHSYTHDYFIMLRQKRRLEKEIATTQDILASIGVRPTVFRPPMGITNPGLGSVLDRMGLVAVNFSCRAFDGGNRRVRRLSEKILNRVRPGSIIMMHDLAPKKETDQHLWMSEVEKVMAGLEKKGLSIVPLSDLIEKSVMEKIPKYSKGSK